MGLRPTGNAVDVGTDKHVDAAIQYRSGPSRDGEDVHRGNDAIRLDWLSDNLPSIIIN